MHQICFSKNKEKQKYNLKFKFNNNKIKIYIYNVLDKLKKMHNLLIKLYKRIMH